MLELYLNRLPVNGPWGGGNMWVTAFYRYSRENNIALINNEKLPHNILIAGLDQETSCPSAEQIIAYKKSQNSNVKVFLRVNENDARKNTNYVDNRLRELSKSVDGTIFVSHWLKKYFEKNGWDCKNSIVIINGVDDDVFKEQKNKLSAENNKINIVAHHWSNNPMKGFDIYEKLDEFVSQNTDFTFTYIGRENKTFKHTNVIKPLFGHQLGLTLGAYDVYVSASRFDPGPNHCLESISCQLPTYVHVDGGGCVEFAGIDHTYKNWDELKLILQQKSFIKNSTKLYNWKECINQYADFIKSF